MDRWHWSENDLKELVVSGKLVPSIFESGALWPLPIGSNGRRKRATNTIFVKEWMYLVGIRPIGPFDCEFEFLAKTAHNPAEGGEVYSRDGTGYINMRTTLADVIANGTFSIEEVERQERIHTPASSRQASPHPLGNAAWWNTSYDVWAMAEMIEREANDRGWGVNQRGRRAGRYPLKTLSAAVATQITETEATRGSKQKIAFKQIENYLRNAGWK